MKITQYILCAVLVAAGLSCRGPEGPSGPAGSGSLTDPTVQPEILETYPPANGVGPFADFSKKEIQIRFNKIMDRASVARSIHFGSNLQTLRIDSSSVHSLGGDIFVCHPVDSSGSSDFIWRIGEVDTLIISAGAKDINGNVISSPVTVTFKPEPVFRVTGTTPTDGATGVASDSAMTIQFNSKVSFSITGAVSISPEIKGDWELPSSTSIRFRADTGFVTRTRYTVTVLSYASDLYGSSIGNNYKLVFTTGSFGIKFTTPSDGAGGVSLFRSIGVVFNSELKLETIAPAFRVTPQLSGKFKYFENQPYFLYEPDTELMAESTYVVTIDSTLRSLRNERMDSTYSFSFKAGQMRLTFASPYYNQQNVTRFLNRIELYFNARLDTGSIREAFIDGGIRGDLSFEYGGSSFFYYISESPLRDNTLYVVGVSNALRSIGGVHLKNSELISFTTAN